MYITKAERHFQLFWNVHSQGEINIDKLYYLNQFNKMSDFSIIPSLVAGVVLNSECKISFHSESKRM